MPFPLLTLALAMAANWNEPGVALALNPRRILRPKDNVGEMIKRNRDNASREGEGRLGASKDRYTIHTEIEAGSGSAGKELAMDVVEAINPAVTLDTIIKDERGNEFTVQDSDVLLYTLLVTDVDTADGADTFAMLAINPENNDMHGIVEKKGKRGDRVPYKIKQTTDENNGVAMAEEEVYLPPSDWHCDVADEIPGDEEELERRRLEESHLDHHHQHHHHSHQGPDENLPAMESLFKSVQGIKSNPLNKSRRLESASYHFQVDMFVEIDNKFISNLGGLNNAINYVNTLVTGANVVYEKEIDTHLRVTNIKVSSLYDGATSAPEALGIMQANYGGNTWHSPDVDLHHALLASIGGGVAYIGVVCHSKWGFGLTGGMSGSFVSMSQPTVWDMKGMMHEIGHNFGSGHTHDVNSYDPLIDGCGISCPTSTGYGWSTIMSYCQWCPGSYNNVMYSFGADYDGSGDVNDLSNWPANPSMVANYDSTHYSVDPNREAQRMYLHVFSKAPSGCVDLSAPAPQTTSNPTQSPTSSFGAAFYDNILGAPKCAKVSTFCDSGTLLKSRDSIAGISEPNGPNTLDSCTDGAAGSYHTDESIDNIRISSVGGYIQPGATIEITAQVWAYNPSTDFVDFYYANDATNPQWQFISTVKPTSSSANTVSTRYTLGNGNLQAVRVVIRYNGAAKPCPSGSYDDVDDLAFAVQAATPKPTTPTNLPTPQPTTPRPTLKPTQPPTTPLPTPKPVTPAPSNIPTSQPTTPRPTLNPTQPPTTPLPTPKPVTPAPAPVPVTTPNPTSTTNQAGNTVFDSDLGVPICATSGSFCDSGTLLMSRDSIAGLSEKNGPNSLDSCIDGTLGTYHSDESVDNIKISTVGGGELQVGSTVQVTATVWAYNPSADYADFFYANDARNPQWQFLDTVKPTTPGINTLSIQFTLAGGPGDVQALRVAFRVNGVASSCPQGSYDDVDDIAFVVKSAQPTPPPTRRPTIIAKTTKRLNALLSSPTN